MRVAGLVLSLIRGAGSGIWKLRTLRRGGDGWRVKGGYLAIGGLVDMLPFTSEFFYDIDIMIMMMD